MTWRAAFVLLITLLLPGCGLVVRSAQQAGTEIANSELFRRGRHGTLSEKELEWAKVAWSYFVNNYNEETGLVNGADGFPTASVWNIADTIAATVAARRLGLIDDYTFDHRITPLLEFLNSMELSYGQLPNLFYATNKKGMTDSSGSALPKAGGKGGGSGDSGGKEGKKDEVGWSAVDIGRLLIWLQNLRSYAPQYAEYIDKAVLRWNFCQVIDDCGRLRGLNRNSSASPPARYPEEPLGYQEYALMGYAAWGFPRPQGQPPPPSVRIYGIELPGSREDARTTGSSNPLVSTPYLLQGLEFNWDRLDDQSSLDSFSSDTAAAELAERIYAVQERRYQQERIFTARAEQHRQQEPYILYDAIFADGYAWNTVTPDGKAHPDLSLVSTSAAFAMWALWKTPYTDGLMQLVGSLHDPPKKEEKKGGEGWFEGRREKNGAYEKTISSTTNAMVLEALDYKAHGKLYRAPNPRGYADIVLEDEFRRPPCSPPERKGCPQQLF